MFAVLLIGANLSIMILSHLHKARIYGFAFYHIPSVSMTPTLLPGDIILIDTWLTKTQSAKIGDILVFKQNDKSVVMVKRVRDIRQTGSDQEYFMTGDNQQRSTDSRSFGWITQDKLIGKVKFVWFSFRERRFFSTVH